MDDRLKKIFTEALKNGLSRDDIKQQLNNNVKKADVKKDNDVKNGNVSKNDVSKCDEKTSDAIYKRRAGLLAVIVVLWALGIPNDAYKNPVRYAKDLFDDYIYSSENRCLVQVNTMSIEITRPLVNCDICRNVKEIPVVYNMTQEYFLKHHAYTGVPVLVKNGTGNWTALSVFGWRYFRKLYAKLKAFRENEELGCQFFPYKTDFRNLKDVFRISKERANLTEDQWYVGWSNCVPRVQSILRHHYQRPTFLPDDSESSSLDWIFMGGSGTGALMHIDSVNRPSWQAMVRGRKTWYLEPPPECEAECPHSLQADMHPGDILVCDTNKWYHMTYIHPGDLSVTIGSEYD